MCSNTFNRLLYKCVATLILGDLQLCPLKTKVVCEIFKNMPSNSGLTHILRDIEILQRK